MLSPCGCYGSGRPDPSTSSGQRLSGSDGGSGQASRLNTLSGISGLWGRWRRSSLADFSLGSSLNHLQDTHTHAISQRHAHTHCIYSAFVGQHGPTQRADTVSAQISPSPSVTRQKSEEEGMSNWDFTGSHKEMETATNKQQHIKTLITSPCWQLRQSVALCCFFHFCQNNSSPERKKVTS